MFEDLERGRYAISLYDRYGVTVDPLDPDDEVHNLVWDPDEEFLELIQSDEEYDRHIQKLKRTAYTMVATVIEGRDLSHATVQKGFECLAAIPRLGSICFGFSGITTTMSTLSTDTLHGIAQGMIYSSDKIKALYFDQSCLPCATPYQKYWDDLGKIISTPQHLEAISLRENNMHQYSPENMKCLLTAVSKSKSCKHLDLRENYLYCASETTLKVLHDMLISGLPNISSIAFFEEYELNQKDGWLQEHTRKFSEYFDKIDTILRHRQLALILFEKAQVFFQAQNYIEGVFHLFRAVNFYPESPPICNFFRAVSADLQCPIALRQLPAMRLYCLEQYQSKLPTKNRFARKQEELRDEVVKRKINDTDTINLLLSVQEEVTKFIVNNDAIKFYYFGDEYKQAWNHVTGYIFYPYDAIISLIPKQITAQTLNLYDSVLDILYVYNKNLFIKKILDNLKSLLTTPSILAMAFTNIDLSDEQAYKQKMQELSSVMEEGKSTNEMISDFKRIFCIFHLLTCRQELIRSAHNNDFVRGLRLIPLVDLKMYPEDEQKKLQKDIDKIRELSAEHEQALELQRLEQERQQRAEQKRFEQNIDAVVNQIIDDRVAIVTPKDNKKKFKPASAEKRRALFDKIKAALVAKQEFLEGYIASTDEAIKRLFIRKSVELINEAVSFQEKKGLRGAKVTIKSDVFNKDEFTKLILDMEDDFAKPTPTAANQSPYHQQEFAAKSKNLFLAPSQSQQTPPRSLQPSPSDVKRPPPQNPEFVKAQQANASACTASSPLRQLRKPLPVPPAKSQAEIDADLKKAYETPPGGFTFDPAGLN